MYRNLLIGVLLSLCLSVLGSISLAQTPNVALTSRAAVTDLRPTLQRMRSEGKLTQGRVRVFTRQAQPGKPALSLFVTVAKGAVTKWECVDAKGASLPVTYAKAVTCEACVTIDPDGDGPLPPSRECWEVPCDTLPPMPATAIQ
jgi:hypothetical protein